ncbi:MAG: rhomboid family intramembrane serine protease [Planctomycetota bacterium]
MSRERWQGRSPLEAFPVSIGLLGACAILFVATDFVYPGERGDAIKHWGMNMQAGFSEGEFWRPVTAMFLHADVLHVLLNMYALLQLCPALERTIGSARFSAIYFGGGIAGSLASLAIEPASLGASGAICGIMATFVRFERVRLGSFRAVLRDPIGSQFLVWLLITIAFGFSVARISNAGHIGGMIGGWAVSAAVVPALSGQDRGRLSVRPSWIRSALVLAGLAALAVADARPVWSADYCARAAARASERGERIRALELIGAARRAPLARDKGLYFALGAAEQDAGREEVAEAFYSLAEDSGYRGEELGHNQAILIEGRGDEKALLAHLRKWKGRGGLDQWEERRLQLEAMEARGELKR